MRTSEGDESPKSVGKEPVVCRRGRLPAPNGKEELSMGDIAHSQAPQQQHPLDHGCGRGTPSRTKHPANRRAPGMLRTPNESFTCLPLNRFSIETGIQRHRKADCQSDFQSDSHFRLWSSPGATPPSRPAALSSSFICCLSLLISRSSSCKGAEQCLAWQCHGDAMAIPHL